MSVTKIKRKKKNVYQAQVYVRGVRLSSKVFENKTQAYIWHDREKDRLEKGETIEEKELKELLFCDCVEKYIKEYLPKLRASSQRKILLNLKNLSVNSPLNKVKMSDLKAKEISLWISWFQKKTKKCRQRQSFKTEFRRLVAVLNWWRNYVDPSFVVPVVKMHRDICYETTQKLRRPDYFARPEEIQLWLQKLQKISNPVYYRLAKFMILTGARVSEACGLLWKEVIFEEKFVRVVRTADWGGNKITLCESTKTKASNRLLVLPERLVELLRVMKSESPENPLVFHSIEGEMVSYTSIRWAFDKSFKACNLPWRGTHICRHTYATMALMATKSLSAVQASLGHTDQAMTQRYAKAVALINSDMAERTASMYESKSLTKSLTHPQKTLNESSLRIRESDPSS